MRRRHVIYNKGVAGQQMVLSSMYCFCGLPKLVNTPFCDDCQAHLPLDTRQELKDAVNAEIFVNLYITAQRKIRELRAFTITVQAKAVSA
jgi:hypothetical protein